MLPRHRLALSAALASAMGAGASGLLARGDDAAPAPAPSETPAQRGYRLLTTKAYLPATLDRTTFERLFTVWPEPERTSAEKASPGERRRMLFERYGFTPLPEDPTRPLQYVEAAGGAWSISCLACHSGALEGKPIPGLANANFSFQSLADDMEALRAKDGFPRPLGSLLRLDIPLGESVGTTNAVVFSAALLSFRDKDLNVVFPRKPPRFVHHDLDAPAWWNVAKRDRLYMDGFAKKDHRSLMQFLMIPTNGAARVKGWEADFRDVLAYVESLEAPRWPYAIDRDLAARGRAVFETTCATCHGTYGVTPTYPGIDVPISVIGTDRLRHDAVSRDDRILYGDSWFTAFDPSTVHVDPKGYVAPPLDGVWASAPYLHNGAVPTLWHLLHPDARPAAWSRAEPFGPYDVSRVGLRIKVGDAVPAGLPGHERRLWFDTSRAGKSAKGHRFPDALTEPEKVAVLEYLKTL